MVIETYNITLDFCGICLQFESALPLRVANEIEVFRTEAAPDVTAHVRSGSIHLPENRRISGPVTVCASVGERFLSAGRNGQENTSVVIEYRPDFSDVEVLVDAAHFGRSVQQVCKILQVFPVRELLAQYDAVLLHSSRVEIGGRAIVFSAPPGTGKTTQARLWEQYAGARIVSNDRTIVRRIKGRFVTSGFPVDGSEPVLDPAIIPLGAIVLLRQGEVNRAEHMSAGKALAFLMEQTSLSRWDGAGISQAMLFWSDLLAEYPAILLTCRPDEGAVRCLQEALEKREGIKYCQ